MILFSASTDGGNSWSEAKRISQRAGDCIDSDLTAEGAMPCVGPQGQVYVAWSNQKTLLLPEEKQNENTIREIAKDSSSTTAPEKLS